MALLAQSADRKALNLVVVGSSPTVGAFWLTAVLLPCTVKVPAGLKLVFTKQHLGAVRQGPCTSEVLTCAPDGLSGCCCIDGDVVLVAFQRSHSSAG